MCSTADGYRKQLETKEGISGGRINLVRLYYTSTKIELCAFIMIQKFLHLVESLGTSIDRAETQISSRNENDQCNIHEPLNHLFILYNCPVCIVLISLCTYTHIFGEGKTLSTSKMFILHVWCAHS
ncbi:uncharacterized protein H6S33_010046 [Morchella sextelata]|uniref:uncharacterized protein n=1 Tax=Morchella sextelata TaxID=1174677 RepID=UPI001D043093|nr:uncharacterized protein H6S33_010046 [Morchella sextelata]KAH0611994.1 hypothetical protein H6S33_010046 [Morchella sextelata]